jgi:metal-responsive CopG/Arc/MetJ family transcriptional regulator
MKVKTSITLSDTLLREIDKIVGKKGNRSVFIEHAIEDSLEKRKREKRDKKDLELINQNAEALNQEAEDVLSYQVDM